MKAILVIDMPTSCLEDCIVSCNKFNAKGTPIPKECPLRPLPETRDVGYPNDDYAVGFGDGWDACLEAITGETE